MEGLGEWGYRRLRELSIDDGGLKTERGVIKAVERFLGVKYDENLYIVDVAYEWIVRH